jgi:hypothetical protein
MDLIDLSEQVDRDFDRARLRAWLRRLADRLRGRPAALGRLPSFDELQRSQRAYNRVRRGVQVVASEKIVGSVGRRRDFDRGFLPLRAGVAERWKRVDRAFHQGRDLPPVSLYRLGDAYFVLDGNHRVSVVRYHGVRTVEAEVTELRPVAGGPALERRTVAA